MIRGVDGALGLLQGRHTHAAGEIGLIRGVDGALGDHLDRKGLGGGEGGPDGLGVADRTLAEDEQDALSVGYAVEIDDQGVFSHLLVPARKASRAEEAHFLQVEEDKGDLPPQLLGEGGHGIQEGGDTRGVVVGGVSVGGACHDKPAHGQDQDQPQVIEEQNVRFDPAGGQAEEDPRHKSRGDGHQQDSDQDLVEQEQPDALGGDEVGERHDRAGIVVGGVDHLGGVGVPHHDIAGAEVALFGAAVVAQGRGGGLDVVDEGGLLLAGLADLMLFKDGLGGLGHGVSPLR